MLPLQWEDCYKAEEAIEDSGIKCTFLQQDFFMQDFLRLAGDTIRNRQAFYFPPQATQT